MPLAHHTVSYTVLGRVQIPANPVAKPKHCIRLSRMSPAQSVAVKMGNPDSEEHNYAIARSRLRLPLQFVFYTVPIRIVYNRDVKTNGGIRRYPEFPECREINAHAQTVCTRPSLSRGRPGNEARMHHAKNRGNKEIPLAILSRILAQSCVTLPT